jgi:hypothetical protein
MSHLRLTVLTIALATASISSWAQADAEHTQHHPNAPAAEQSVAKTALATKPASVDQIAAMDSKMKAMHEMHEKMMTAKTPEERNALMAEDMKTMQDCMAMMGAMGGAGMGGIQGQKPMPGNMNERQQMMEKRMEMMEAMMQMMMDRMPPPVTK